MIWPWLCGYDPMWVQQLLLQYGLFYFSFSPMWSVRIAGHGSHFRVGLPNWFTCTRSIDEQILGLILNKNCFRRSELIMDSEPLYYMCLFYLLIDPKHVDLGCFLFIILPAYCVRIQIQWAVCLSIHSILIIALCRTGSTDDAKCRV